jgi:hypothetical protein
MCGANLLEIQFLCINSVALLGLPGFRTFSKIWFFTDFHSITCLGLGILGLCSGHFWSIKNWLLTTLAALLIGYLLF